jgi:hypothetical protein
MKAGSQAARPRFWTADFAAKLQISFGFHPCLTFVHHSSVKRNKEANMEQVNLGSVIEQAITRSSQNRLGEKPPVLQAFLYESLLTSDANAAVEISLRRRSLLKDLTAFIGLLSSYWVQLRISGRGLKIVEQIIEDLFAEVGYRCEEWVGVEGSDARLGIFGTIDVPNQKMVFCLESTRHRLRCDLLVPVNDGSPAACPAESAGQA